LVGVPDIRWKLPAGQLIIAVQRAAFVVLLKNPDWHGGQILSFVVVPSIAIHVPGWQICHDTHCLPFSSELCVPYGHGVQTWSAVGVPPAET
jgi:hypothetical protein